MIFVDKNDLPLERLTMTCPQVAMKSSWLVDRGFSPRNNGLINTHSIHGTGIFSYIYYKNQPNVGKYTIHGSCGIRPY